MRALKFVVNAFILFVFLPVAIVAVLGIVFSPLQTSARAVEPRTAFEASDVMWNAAAESGASAEPEAELLETSENAPVELAGEAADGAIGRQDASIGEIGAELPNHYTSDQLRVQGVIYEGDYRYTWYSQRVLPGGGLSIEGRHVSDEGYVVDAQDRVVVASSDLPYGTELDVPFGSGRAVVLDTGCAPGTIDVYTAF